MASDSKQNRVLLPDDVKPVFYRLHLTPDLVNFTFAGKEDVDIVVKKATTTIVLHALEITIKSAKLVKLNAEAQSITYDKENETYSLDFGKTIPTGEETLTIEFEGILNDKMAGFYRSKYIVNGETRYSVRLQ